jgi:hypothetical protein
MRAPRLVVRLAIYTDEVYLISMATTAHRSPSKAGSSSKIGHSSTNGRFLSVASLTPVTKRATITSAQADKAVKDYLDSHKR